MVPAMKPTKFMTNSIAMASQLQQRCKRDHEHQHLVGNRCRDAAFYPIPLVKAIIRGMVLQAEETARAIECQEGIGKVCAMPMSQPQSQPKAEGLTYSKVPKYGSNRTLPVVYDPTNFKNQYTDEYTGETLPPQLIRDAIEDELNYFNSKVWQMSTMEEMQKVPDHILVRSRWVLCNKGDAQAPDVRARLVSCELNKGDRNDMFSASTPPLEAKRMLFARYVSERERKGKPLRLSFVDVRKAYFNALPERAIYMRLPKEMGFPPSTIARQVRCVYGTRDA